MLGFTTGLKFFASIYCPRPHYAARAMDGFNGYVIIVPQYVPLG